MDPEEWREIAADYQHAAAEAVTRVGGHVAKYLGDGLVVYFGWPEAHEDDGERAVRAGLGIVEAVGALNVRHANEPSAPKLAVRVGIDTGAVVVGHGGGRDADVFGDAPNIASRVQSEAAPDSVFITDAVHRLVSGLVVVEDRGAHQLKGIEHPLHLYRVIQPSVTRRRSHRQAAHVAIPFVGRDDEMRLLLARWDRTREGQGQVVLVAGEAGIGKTRLVEEFRETIKEQPHLWVECAGEQFQENTPFHAVAQMLNQGLGWSGDETKEQRAAQLEGALQLAGMKLDEAMPLIAEMLNLPASEKYPALKLAPEIKRKRLMAALAQWVLAATRNQPMMLLTEDLHWVDPSTLELAQMLVEQGATAPLMLLYTTRPEFRAPWPMRSHHAQITLNRLNDRHTREMVAGVASRAALAKDLIDAVVKRTDGVPLFAEELTRLILEGHEQSAAREIPATLHDSLTARLDRLGTAKETAQIASVIGREFSYELLHTVSPASEDDLQSALRKLSDAELIYARGVPPDATYQFKHALIQDAAYEALLKSRRKELHHRVAAAIIERFPALAEEQPQLPARHFSGAGEAEPAIVAWTKGSLAAVARGALKEAEEYCREALAAAESLPESPQRDARSLPILVALTGLLSRTRGYSAAETMAASERACGLAEKTGQLAQMVGSSLTRWGVALVRGNFTSAQPFADQILDLARREGSPRSMASAYQAQIETRHYLGDLGGVEELVEGLVAFRTLAAPESFVTPMGYAAYNALALGYLDKAELRMAAALAYAREHGDEPYISAIARDWEAIYCEPLDSKRAGEAGAEALAIAEKHGFAFWREVARIYVGLAQARLGSPQEGAALIRAACEGFLQSGQMIAGGLWFPYLAEAEALAGNMDQAFTAINKAFDPSLTPYSDGTLWEVAPLHKPNALTCRGGLYVKAGRNDLAEADFLAAIAEAQKMSARFYELLAAIPLAKLLRDTNRRGEARAILAPLYGWFTEGLDTPPLKEAKALLDQLG